MPYFGYKTSSNGFVGAEYFPELDVFNLTITKGYYVEGNAAIISLSHAEMIEVRDKIDKLLSQTSLANASVE